MHINAVCEDCAGFIRCYAAFSPCLSSLCALPKFHSPTINLTVKTITFLHFLSILSFSHTPPWPVPSLPSCTLKSLTVKTLKIRSKSLAPFLFFIFPWGLFVSSLSECQASAWVSKQTSSSRNDVSENCHQLGMSCQLLCWANDYCWMLWELKVSNLGHIFFCLSCSVTHACAVWVLIQSLDFFICGLWC